MIRSCGRHVEGVDTATLPLTLILSIARKWIVKHPGLRSRIERAVALVQNVRATSRPGHWVVEGSDGHEWHVEVKGHWSACNCPDSRNGHHCKHRIAVALAVVASAILYRGQSRPGS